MSTVVKSRSYSRKSAGVLLLVGVLVGITVGGGVGVFASAVTKSVTVCANKKTNMLRYAKSGRCSRSETRVVLNQTGAAGADGIGTAGPAGATGPAGAAGVAGVNATSAITQQSVCDGTDTDTVANELCKVGMIGPGGGHIFYVDYNDQHADLNYLEAAPVGWGNGISVDEANGEVTGTATVDPALFWCSNTSLLLAGKTWANAAIGAGATNTSTADATCSSGAIQAASDYAGGSKTDWFLPSMSELALIYTNLRQIGTIGFSNEAYWSSTEYGDINAWIRNFNVGEDTFNGTKDVSHLVRPVRSF
jgi:hypothetical protein